MANKLGQFIAEKRQALQLSQNALAKKAGISVSAVNRVEAGETTPETKTLEAIATALNVPLSTLTELVQGKAIRQDRESLSHLIAQLSEKDKELVEQCLRVFIDYKRNL